MSRDQRVADNFALNYAQQLALKYRKPLLVVFNIVESFPSFNERNASFMFKNLENMEQTLQSLRMSMILTKGEPETTLPKAIEEFSISVVVTDFSPLHIAKTWLSKVVNEISIPVIQVDTHNIIPCWIASPKQEYSARTLRPKIHKLLDDYFSPLPDLKEHPYDLTDAIGPITWDKEYKKLQIDKSVKAVSWIKSGEQEARTMLQNFITNKLDQYADHKNDPTKSVLSNLSAYLHFGQISAQRVAWEITSAKTISKNAKDVFLEELIVRKELADNFCYYNNRYDSVQGFHPWAQTTLEKHLMDRREYNYSLEEFEKAKTHDDLWNAAQLEMVSTGKMYGYLRMYWAKKMLEWTETPAEAQNIAITLNDKYELDGRDPNGYTGIAWSIGGIHDRPWGPERPIFGLVRYMNYNGAKRKFNVPNYIQKIASSQE